MQEIYRDGTEGEPMPLSFKKMLESLKNENVDHVKVFKTSEEQAAAMKTRLTEIKEQLSAADKEHRKL